jgi:hypothetical protein
MIDIVGNIKVDENRPERIKYLLACIRSYRFLADHCRFILSLETPSDKLQDLVCKEFEYFGSDNCLLIIKGKCVSSYGAEYIDLLRKSNNKYVINFMEDQFMALNEIDILRNILDAMGRKGAEVLKASFFTVVQNSTSCLSCLDWWSDNIWGRSFLNSESFHKIYQQYYGKRYYIGCNFITTREFALKFWNRDLSNGPHKYEICDYDKQCEHIVMFPGYEIQAAIDDSHGEPNSHLLGRTDCEKWNEIWKSLN